MGHGVFCCLQYLQIAKSFRSVGCEQFLDQILGCRVDMRWKVDASRQNLFIDAKWIVIKERRVARKHLKDQNSERPPVYRLSVSF